MTQNFFLRDPQKEITTGRLAHKVVAGYNLGYQERDI